MSFCQKISSKIAPQNKEITEIDALWMSFCNERVDGIVNTFSLPLCAIPAGGSRTVDSNPFGVNGLPNTVHSIAVRRDVQTPEHTVTM